MQLHPTGPDDAVRRPGLEVVRVFCEVPPRIDVVVPGGDDVRVAGGPHVLNKRQAVEGTLKIIARTLEEQPQGIHLTIDDYAEYIE